VGALIFSAILSGQIVARTGRYKLLITASMFILAIGLFFMTGLTAQTNRPILWLWMVATGLGVGPSFAVFTVIVQSSVTPRFIGAATASLTFFQQIGGTIGLTLASTFLAAELIRQIPLRLAANGIPQQVIDQFGQASSGGQLDLTGTGDLGQRILAATPEQFRSFIEPLIPQIVQAIHESFSLAIASSFWIGIVAALVAGVLCLFIQEKPLVQAVEEPMEAVPAS